MKILVILLIVISNVYAGNIEIVPDSRNIIVGEIFGITMKVETQSGDEPEITMEGRGIEILEKENQGVSSTTTYINGKLSSKREYIIRYQLKSNKTGRVSLINITADTGKEKLRHNSLYFSSTNEPQYNRNIFVQAEPSKTVIYAGEGVMLRYYLYNKINIATFNIKKFPSLPSFMKRFLQESTRPERINFKGEMYERRILYSMVVYPDKQGGVKIDPLVAEVSYPTRRSNSPFNSLGLGIRNYAKKSFSSPAIKVNVLPLPDGAPEGFTGLVGQHEFDLSVSRDKYLVNEPVEIKLRVKGQGNLEDYDVRELIENENFETFENSANLETTNSVLSTKTFNLTYLPRKETKLPATSLPFSYFDPSQKKYISVTVQRPEITVLGGAPAQAKKFPVNPQSKTVQKSADQPLSLVSPVFIVDSVLEYERLHRILNFILFAIILMIIAIGLKGALSFLPGDDLSMQLRALKKSNMDYKNLYDFLDKLAPKKASVYKKLDDSTLTDQAKSYFKNLLNNKEGILYGGKSKQDRSSFKNKYFKEALEIIKGNQKKNEDS